MTTLIIALLVGAGLFGVGLYGALSQTNLVMIMMGIELMLGGCAGRLVRPSYQRARQSRRRLH